MLVNRYVFVLRDLFQLCDELYVSVESGPELRINYCNVLIKFDICRIQINCFGALLAGLVDRDFESSGGI